MLCKVSFQTVTLWRSREWIKALLSESALREKCPNAGKYGPEKTPYLDTFYTVRRFPVQNPIGAWSGLRTQPCYEVPGDFRVEHVKT